MFGSGSLSLALSPAHQRGPFLRLEPFNEGFLADQSAPARSDVWDGRKVRDFPVQNIGYVRHRAMKKGCRSPYVQDFVLFLILILILHLPFLRAERLLKVDY